MAATIGNNNEATLNNTYYTNSSASNNSTDKLACEVDFNIIDTGITIDLYELHVFTHSGITENLKSQHYNEYYSMSYDGKLYANHSMAFKPSVPVGYKLSCNVTPTTSRVSPSDSPVPGGISAGTTTADAATTDNDELKALLGDNPIATYGDRMTIYDRGVKLLDDYYSHVITFNDQQDNATLISQLEGLTFDVRLKHRRLYKDGSWNSLCLPFNLDVANSPLNGAYTLMQLDNKSHNLAPEGVTPAVYRQTGCSDDGKLYLFFTRVYDHIYAAKPYIIKWDKVTNYDQNDSSFDILDPIFSNAPTVPGGFAAGTTTAANSWYDLGGRRLLHRPTTKGVYIHQGRPFVVM